MRRDSAYRWLVTGALLTLAAAASVGGEALASAGALVSAVSVAAVVTGVWKHRPAAAAGWWVLAAGGFLFLVGRAVLAFQPVDPGEVAPFPSPADAFFLFGYGCLVVGMAMLVRHRSGGTEDDSLLDAVIVATAVGVVVAAYFLAPYVADPEFGALEKVLTVAYALADVVLVAVIVRLAVGSGTRPPSYYLMAASLIGLIAADVLTTLHMAEKLGRSWPVAASALCYVLFGASAIHRSMVQLTQRPQVREVRLSRRRLALLCGALLLVPGLLAVEIARGGHRAVPVLVIGSVVMAVLILGRLAGLVRSKERKAARERVLRHAGAALVAATTREEIQQAALAALTTLVREADVARVAIANASEDGLRVVVAAGHRAEEAIHASIPLDRLPPEVRDGLTDHRFVTLQDRPPLDVAVPEGDVAQVVLVPLSSRGELSGAFLITTSGVLPAEPLLAVETLAGQVSLALESAALSEEIHRRRAERRFRVLVEHSSDLISVVGPDGLANFVSPASSDLLGLAPRELVDRPWLERVHPEDRARISTILKVAASGDGAPEPAELRLRHATGEWRWFEVVVDNALAEPHVAGLVIHARDVTDRKAAELRLAESEARFRSLVQNASDLVLVLDDRLDLSYVSPSITRVLGYDAETLVGHSVLELIHHDDAATASRVVGQADRKSPPTVAELRFRGASGGWVLLEATVSDLRHDPAVAGIVLNARDVTERHRSEERWRAFGSEASHQLRTPLTGLRLTLENALADASTQWRPPLEDALAQVDRLQTTVEDFLALAPRRVASAPPLDVTAVVEDMDAAWRGLIEADGRTLVVDIESPLPVVRSSAATVRQVLGVLIENALKHGDGSIRLVAKEVAGGLALEVSDEGQGLSVKRNGARDRKHMGLALARALAEAEGGRLLLRRAGPCPTFTLFMPASNGS
ncbi:MAG: PAS domain S-box protein [Actinomycetota bacterium]|nr:PAS domain S-box protein [Actinomycetota bacterium]